MKTSRRIAAVIAGAALVCSMAVSASASDGGKTNFSLYVPNDPTYEITVPATVNISAKEATNIPITASNVDYIPANKKVSVTLANGCGVYGRLYLQAKNPNGGNDYLMTLDVKGTDGEWKTGAVENQIKGMELASFTANGSKDYQIKPCALDYPGATNQNLVIQKGAKYTGYVTYGVSLTDKA
ncbi:MAG: hypothetical protein LKE53_04140 [Oscillospiraceae bacterium]|jgi:hypothetical protein|nr:hypothetical protein [Oscillospiraceae bacterium]MDD3261355.1 hypothetical protein [Oscillospiraceae bacterium]